MSIIHVAAGAVTDAEGRVLITRRADHLHQGGLWEFPGGKLDPDEGATEGLARELDEELGIRVLATGPLIRVHHDYGDRRVLLDVHRVTAFAGTPHGREGQPLAWVHPDAMDPAVFPAADRPIITALRLPPLYLITGEDPRNPASFLARLERALASGVRLVQLRAHGLKPEEFARLAERSFALCDAAEARLLLNIDPAQAAGLPGHGLHLTASRLWAINARPDGFEWLGASCHGGEDLARAAALGLDYALLSPVRATATHPDAVPLGWERFATLADTAALPVYALGGLTPADLDQAIAHGAQGIAAIRGLWPE
ncbi:MAG: Nudix family hydrolase [Chromatiaceae bacterium]|nr:Nudix family hydrolase [Chromatiaceae bacterium]